MKAGEEMELESGSIKSLALVEWMHHSWSPKQRTGIISQSRENAGETKMTGLGTHFNLFLPSLTLTSLVKTIIETDFFIEFLV